ATGGRTRHAGTGSHPRRGHRAADSVRECRAGAAEGPHGGLPRSHGGPLRLTDTVGRSGSATR
ncbi:hypothetical protein ACFWIJ_42605, partial [Streptomyces sp. NPDC127079]|uniref:hypothetical protein n=1 Tax=Streptomyces sp. NPDC127079 TaxID=3347132 RepID=UPI003658E324